MCSVTTINAAKPQSLTIYFMYVKFENISKSKFEPSMVYCKIKSSVLNVFKPNITWSGIERVRDLNSDLNTCLAI